MVDKKPIPVCKLVRGKRNSRYFRYEREVVNYSKTKSTKEAYYGLGLHATTTVEGIIDTYDLTKASIRETTMLPEIAQGYFDIDLVGDKGFLSQVLKVLFKEESNINLITPYKRNQKQTLSLKERQLLKERKIIETVYSQLTEQFKIDRCKAKSLEGVITRIIFAIFTHTLAVYLNFQIGRPLLKIKNLVYSGLSP